MLETYLIDGYTIAARSLAQAKMTHAALVKTPKQHGKAIQRARRTQPHYPMGATS